ncbi:MAG: homoserine kinase [Cyanobacteria bacterium J06632_22]
MSPTTVTVTVPATTANLGPGFDCLGAALTLSNRFRFSLADEPLHIEVTGPEADRVGCDRNNLAYKAFTALYQKQDLEIPPIRIDIELGVPLSRGLGSSSTAIVGGLVGANQLAGMPLSRAEIAALATDIEGHPDNVVPALMGGCYLAAGGAGKPWMLCDVAWHPNITPVVAIPDFELSTAAARQVLPHTYSRDDAVFNAAHVGLLLRGLESGNGDWLEGALCDRIHQPYRQTLIPDYGTAHAAALAAGAWGLVISGAGPTLLALAPIDRAAAVAHNLQTQWQPGYTVQAQPLALDRTGTVAVAPANS